MENKLSTHLPVNLQGGNVLKSHWNWICGKWTHFLSGSQHLWLSRWDYERDPAGVAPTASRGLLPSVPAWQGLLVCPAHPSWVAGCKSMAGWAGNAQNFIPALKTSIWTQGCVLTAVKMTPCSSVLLSSAFMEVIEIFSRLENYLENNLF